MPDLIPSSVILKKIEFYPEPIVFIEIKLLAFYTESAGPNPSDFYPCASIYNKSREI